MSPVLSIIINSAPLFLAALGALISELSGKLNIGIEGSILFGAFFACAVYDFVPSPLLSFLVAFSAGALMGLLLSLLSINGRANVFIVGLGINLLAWGLIPLLSQSILGVRGIISLAMDAAHRNAAAVIGLLLTVLAGIGTRVFLSMSNPGLRLSKLYMNEELAGMQGTDVAKYRGFALVFSSAAAGLAGGIIALYLGSYVPNISAGKGWIALVVVFLGDRRLAPMVAASLFFALSQHLSSEAQRFMDTPGMLLGLPFLVTLLALCIYRVIAKRTSIKRRGF